jgi:hypothetical protein
MGEQDFPLPGLRIDQARIACHPARVKVLAMGRRWGKTTLGGVIALMSLTRGLRVAWVAPTYRNARPLWRFCERHVAPVRDRVKVSLAEQAMEFPAARGWLGVYSADNDTSMRGEDFDLVIVDEAARVKQETVQDVIMPTLADRNGRLLLISTPVGLNWFYTEYQRGLGDGRYQAAWRAPTCANPLPSIQRAYYELQERVRQGEFPERSFRQEWDAEFIESEGIVFRNVDAVATGEVLEWATPGHTYVGGVDWGRVGDATVFIILDVEERRVARVERMVGVPFTLQLERLKALQRDFAVQAWCVETNAMGGPLVERLAEEGVPVLAFTTTAASKQMAIEALALAFEGRQITIPRDGVLMGELKAFSATRLPSGLIRYSAPEGLHDDCVMALAFAWHGLGQAASPALIEV